MNLMACRFINLQNVFAGYLKTGVPLIAFDGQKYAQPITGDDIGIYILIPKLAKFFNMPLDFAINIFFYSFLFFPFIIASIAFFLLYKNWLERFVALSGLILLTRFSYAIGDVYIASSAAALCIIPWCLILCTRNVLQLNLFGLATGILVGFFHYIRAYSGVGPLIFVLMIVLSNELKLKNKMLFSCCIAIGLALGAACFENEFAKSARYAQQLGMQVVKSNHVFWHQAYIGLGFLTMKNDDDIYYDDSIASNRVKSINPDIAYCSPEYETVLKNEFLKILQSNTVFILLTLFAKLGVLIYFLIKFANIGLIAAVMKRKPLIIDLAFIAALCFNALFSLIAIPLHEYALGFISCAALWGIVSINNAMCTLDLNYCMFLLRKRLRI